MSANASNPRQHPSSASLNPSEDPSASMDGGAVVTTTTVFSGPLPTASISHVQATASLPIGAIAGGTAGGILLAVILVVGWTWWGRCLKRQAAKERAEYLAAKEVKENTRRNASLSLVPSRNSASSISQQPKKVTFAPPEAPPETTTPSPSQSTTETIKVPADSPSTVTTDISTSVQSQSSTSATTAIATTSTALPPFPKPPDPYGLAYKPTNPSPLSQSLRSPGTEPERSNPTPPPFSRFSHNAIFPLPRNRDPPPPAAHAPHTLVHKGSALSDGSVYSTQSAEEQYTRAPQSLIMAALGHLDLRKQPSGGFLRAYRTSSNANNEGSRLSQISMGSTYSQIDEPPEDVIGYAA